MRKFLLFALLVACIVFPGFPAFADEGVKPVNLVVYKDKDWTVGPESISGFAGYDLISNEFVTGLKTAVVQYKWANLDLGVLGPIGNIDELHQDGIDEGLIGLSIDLPKIKIGANTYLDAGIAVSNNIRDPFDWDEGRFFPNAGCTWEW